MNSDIDSLTEDDVSALLEAEGYALTRRADGAWTIGGWAPGDATLRIDGTRLRVEHILFSGPMTSECHRTLAEFVRRGNLAMRSCQIKLSDRVVCLIGETEIALADAELTILLAAIRAAARRIQREVQALATSEPLAAAYLAHFNVNENFENTAEQGAAP